MSRIVRYSELGFILILALLLVSFAHAHPTDVSDLPRTVTSDFGPRNVNCSKFHQGVDWAYGIGDPVPLLENSSVETLARGSTKLVRLEILGDSSTDHTFRYLHMFNNNSTLPIFVGNYILARRTGSTGDLDLVIVKRDATNDRRAEYMISSIPGDTVDVVFPGDTTATRIRNSANTADAVTVSVLTTAAHPTVGPAGTSGGVAPHLHMDFGFGTYQNIYSHMAEKASTFSLKLLDKNNLPRLDRFVIGPQNVDNYFLKVEIDSRTGLDLEKLGIYVDSVTATNLVREYKYGGTTTAYDPVNVDLRKTGTSCDGPDVSSGSTNGVHNFNNITGWERYIYTDWGTSAGSVTPTLLIEGEHTILFDVLDIRNNIPFASGTNPSIKFNVDQTAPLCLR